MNKEIAALLLGLVLLIGGCSEKTGEDILAEKPVETPEVEETDSPQVEYADWEGDYIFMDDEIEGTLTVSGQQEAEFTYSLNATKKDWSNTLLAEESFEGKGIADSNDANVSTQGKECSGKFILDGPEMTVKMTGAECKLNLDLSGVYQKVPAGKPDLYNIKDGKILLNGLSITDTPADAKALWGNPDIDKSTDEDIHLFEETVHTYADEKMRITYYQHKLYAMTVAADKEKLAEIAKAFPGTHYKDVNSDTELFHIPENGHLLIYRNEAIGAENPELLLIPADENFTYAVESGIYVPVTK